MFYNLVSNPVALTSPSVFDSDFPLPLTKEKFHKFKYHCLTWPNLRIEATWWKACTVKSHCKALKTALNFRTIEHSDLHNKRILWITSKALINIVKQCNSNNLTCVLFFLWNFDGRRTRVSILQLKISLRTQEQLLHDRNTCTIESCYEHNSNSRLMSNVENQRELWRSRGCIAYKMGVLLRLVAIYLNEFWK